MPAPTLERLGGDIGLEVVDAVARGVRPGVVGRVEVGAGVVRSRLSGQACPNDAPRCGQDLSGIAVPASLERVNRGWAAPSARHPGPSARHPAPRAPAPRPRAATGLRRGRARSSGRDPAAASEPLIRGSRCRGGGGSRRPRQARTGRGQRGRLVGARPGGRSHADVGRARTGRAANEHDPGGR